MNIEKITVGYLRCNCYLLEIDNHILIIDPGAEANKIIKAINNRKVIGIVITHNHFDHIGAIDDLTKKYDIKVYDKSNLPSGINIIDKFKFEVIYTPGHKEDAISLYFSKDKIMFTGDFLFRNSIGRVDLPGGNINDMLSSIDKIKKYDKDIVIYPGHGEKTTLGYEINNNLYFKEYL